MSVFQYHEQTKHHVNRYAKSLGYMDWENQPTPFRMYSQTNIMNLSFLETEKNLGSHLDLYTRKKLSSEFSKESIGNFLELSLGLSAWKAMGASKWALRMNPSSGNLHPTEGYILIPGVDGLASGIYHYNSLLHSLEMRGKIEPPFWENIHIHFKRKGFFVALSSIFWRESWKYGERALRYCNHDVGHAIAALSFAGSLFGWSVKYLNTLSTKEIEMALGFERTKWKELEEEHGDLLCYVFPNGEKEISRDLPEEYIAELSLIDIKGEPNQLSHNHNNWNIIYETAKESKKARTQEEIYLKKTKKFFPSQSKLHAHQIIRQRRSAVAYDREGEISKEVFLAILDKTLPRNGSAPFDVEIAKTSVHLLLFVHNVKDIEPGIYFFLRNQEDLENIQAEMKESYAWKEIEPDFPLYLLEQKDIRQKAQRLSCNQEIAGESCFSLGMLAKFRETLEEAPFNYYKLFWEAGMIGQVLYLEAEAHGVRGTGIGCYFDDVVHTMIGLKNNTYQSLYHFTIGHPVHDSRLTTLPAYHHLEKNME